MSPLQAPVCVKYKFSGDDVNFVLMNERQRQKSGRGWNGHGKLKQVACLRTIKRVHGHEHLSKVVFEIDWNELQAPEKVRQTIFVEKTLQQRPDNQVDPEEHALCFVCDLLDKSRAALTVPVTESPKPWMAFKFCFDIAAYVSTGQILKPQMRTGMEGFLENVPRST